MELDKIIKAHLAVCDVVGDMHTEWMNLDVSTLEAIQVYDDMQKLHEAARVLYAMIRPHLGI